MANHLPARDRSRVELCERGDDDALARLPQLVDARQAAETRMLAHPVEHREDPPPHVELTEDEGVHHYRRRDLEARGFRQRRREHGVDENEIGASVATTALTWPATPAT